MAHQHYPYVYKEGQIHFDNISLSRIFEKVKTPFYLYSSQVLEKNFHSFLNSAKKHHIPHPLICFALKSNPNIHLLKSLASAGCGADIVSKGELDRALDAGIPPEKIVFSGVGKSDEEIYAGLSSSVNGIYSFNVESIEELQSIAKIARELNKTARVALRFNPRVETKTHHHISTGHSTHKFGLLKEDIISAIKNKNLWNRLKLVGVSMHIGSQLTCLEATKMAFQNLASLVEEISLPLEFLDLGGGLGINYSPEDDTKFFSVDRYMKLAYEKIVKPLNHPSMRIVFEPGRILVARAGIFVTEVIRTKKSGEHYFVIVDGGMNDFARTSLYDAYHEIKPVMLNDEREIVNTNIVGPICETADKFASNRPMQRLATGDKILIADAGAYGFSMASHYNLRSLPKEVIINQQGKIIID